MSENSRKTIRRKPNAAPKRSWQPVPHETFLQPYLTENLWSFLDSDHPAAKDKNITQKLREKFGTVSEERADAYFYHVFARDAQDDLLPEDAIVLADENPYAGHLSTPSEWTLEELLTKWKENRLACRLAADLLTERFMRELMIDWNDAPWKKLVSRFLECHPKIVL